MRVGRGPCIRRMPATATPLQPVLRRLCGFDAVLHRALAGTHAQSSTAGCSSSAQRTARLTGTLHGVPARVRWSSAAVHPCCCCCQPLTQPRAGHAAAGQAGWRVSRGQQARRGGRAPVADGERERRLCSRASGQRRPALPPPAVVIGARGSGGAAGTGPRDVEAGAVAHLAAQALASVPLPAALAEQASPLHLCGGGGGRAGRGGGKGKGRRGAVRSLTGLVMVVHASMIKNVLAVRALPLIVQLVR